MQSTEYGVRSTEYGVPHLRYTKQTLTSRGGGWVGWGCEVAAAIPQFHSKTVNGGASKEPPQGTGPETLTKPFALRASLSMPSYWRDLEQNGEAQVYSLVAKSMASPKISESMTESKSEDVMRENKLEGFMSWFYSVHEDIEYESNGCSSEYSTRSVSARISSSVSQRIVGFDVHTPTSLLRCDEGPRITFQHVEFSVTQRTAFALA